MSDRFPLLHLNDLCMGKIIDLLDFPSLIELSLGSEILKNQIILNEKNSGIKIDIFCGNEYESVILNGSNRKDFVLKQTRFCRGRLFAVTLNGEKWHMRKKKSEWNWSGDYLDYFFKSWLKFFRELFNCNFGDCTFAGKFPTRKALFPDAVSTVQADKVDIGSVQVTRNHIYHILTQFRAKKLKFKAKVYRGKEPSTIRFGKSLNFEDISVQNWPSVNYKQFFKDIGICKTMRWNEFSESEITINEILKSWYASTNVTLEELTIRCPWPSNMTNNQYESEVGSEEEQMNPNAIFDDENFDMERTVRNLPAIRGSRKQSKLLTERLRTYNLENGMDIRRKDGVWATVAFKKSSKRVRFKMILKVWKVENPHLT